MPHKFRSILSNKPTRIKQQNSCRFTFLSFTDLKAITTLYLVHFKTNISQKKNIYIKDSMHLFSVQHCPKVDNLKVWSVWHTVCQISSLFQ